MFHTLFLFVVYCVFAYAVSENDSNAVSILGKFSHQVVTVESGTSLNLWDYVSTKVFLVPEKSESLFENSTLFLNCDVTKWVQSSNASSSHGQEVKNSNLTKLFKRISEFSTRNDDRNVTCLLPRNVSSSSLITASATSDSSTTTFSYTNMTCLIRSMQKISEAVMRSKNKTLFNIAQIFENSTDRSECWNVFTEGRYTCLVIYEDTVVIPSVGDDDHTTTSVTPKFYYPPFRITVPDELANELEEKIRTDINISLIFVLLLGCTLIGIVLWIMYLVLFVSLPKLLRRYGCHFCYKRHQRPKKPNN